MYETMAVWETDPPWPRSRNSGATSPLVWQAASKVVYSTTLHDVSTAKTQLERNFEPDAIRDLKASAARDLTVGGPNPPRTLSRPGSSMNVSRSSGP
jgi:hypothetical protein